MNELNIILTKSGLSVTAQRYLGGVAAGSAIPLFEVEGSGFYTGHMAGAAGDYQLVFRADGENVGAGVIRWDGSVEILPATGGSIPTAAEIRQEIDMNSSKLDVAVSSRLAPDGTLARVTLTDTATTLTNAPASVTPADIWSHATRTITGGAVDAIPAADISAIRAKTDLLNPTRLAQVSTVETTGAQLAAALS